jgi:hypothetical protein
MAAAATSERQAAAVQPPRPASPTRTSSYPSQDISILDFAAQPAPARAGPAAAPHLYTPRSSTPLGTQPASPPPQQAALQPEPLPLASPDSLPSLDAAAPALRSELVGDAQRRPLDAAAMMNAGRLPPGSGLGLGLPGRGEGAPASPPLQPHEVPRPSSPVAAPDDERQAPPAPQSGVPAWRNMPGFEDLSESWDPASPVIQSLAPPANLALSSSDSGHTGGTGSTVRPPVRLGLAGSDGPRRPGAASLETKLRAGPSSPSNRVPSHDAAVADRIVTGSSGVSGSFRDALSASAFGPGGTSTAPSTAAPRRASSEASEGSSVSGAKVGFGARESKRGSSSSDEEEVNFGTAKEPDVEQTFVELSQAESLPPILKPAWAKNLKGRGVERAGGDMFTPLKLQSMWRTPTPEARQSAASSNEEVKARGASPPGPTIEVASPEHESRRSFARVSPPQAGPSRSPSPPASRVQSRAPSGPFTFTSRAGSSPDFAAAPRMLGFGMAGVEGTPRRGPLTPRAPNTPLSLFAGRTKNVFPPAVPFRITRAREDSPRAAARAAAAAAEKRMEEERERERKRLRLADRPGSAHSSSAHSEEEEARFAPVHEPLGAGPPPPRRDYVREGPDFLAVIQGVRLPSDDYASLQRDAELDLSGSSDLEEQGQESGLTLGEAHFATRSGARAPTPSATSPLRLSGRRIPSANRSFVSFVDGDDESPRKLFRRFSAVQQAQQEFEAEAGEDSFERRERTAREELEEEARDREMAQLEARLAARERARSAELSARAEEHDLHEAMSSEEEPIPQPARQAPQAPERVPKLIGPEDLPSDLDQLGGGRMTFDRATMRWISVKAARRAQQEQADELPAAGSSRGLMRINRDLASGNASAASGDSTDPFKDIESFGTTRDASVVRAVPARSEAQAPVASQSPRAEARRRPAAREEQRAPPARSQLPVRLAIPRSGSNLRNEIDFFSDGDSTVRSQATTRSNGTRSQTARTQTSGRASVPDAAELRERESPRKRLSVPKTQSHAPLTPPARAPVNIITTPLSTFATPRAPRSILKGMAATPDQLLARSEARSISFADVGAVGAQRPHYDEEPDDFEDDDAASLHGMLSQMTNLALQRDAELAEGEQVDPREASQEWHVTPTRGARTPMARRSVVSTGRSPWNMTALRERRHHGEMDAEMTFLTDASFAFAHDRILELITDVAPWEPGWEEMDTIDLSGRRVESVVRIKEFLPRLQHVKL